MLERGGGGEAEEEEGGGRGRRRSSDLGCISTGFQNEKFSSSAYILCAEIKREMQVARREGNIRTST